MRKTWRHLLQALFMPVLALALLGVSACSTQERAAAVAGLALMSEARSADYTLQSGDVEVAVKSVDLSASDRERVDKALGDYALARQNLRNLAQDLDQVPQMLVVIGQERERLRGAYSELASVVKANWDQYEASVQNDLSRWRREAYALSYSYQAFTDIVHSPPDPMTKHDVIESMLEIVRIMALRG